VGIIRDITAKRRMANMEDEFRELRDRIIERFFSRLNDEQLAAVLSENGRVLVAACPGAGKTQVIINRILYLKTFGMTYRSSSVPPGLRREEVDELRRFLGSDAEGFAGIPEVLTRDSVPEEEIVVITFTRMAARGMEERYRKLAGHGKRPFFGTFHSLFYRILESSLGRPCIISEADAAGVIRRVLGRYADSAAEDKVMAVLNDISGWKNRGAEGQPFKPRTEEGIFSECLEVYEDFKAGRGLMDFDDITLRCCALLKEDEALLRSYWKLFSCMLVDEFQDCDGQQILALKLFAAECSLFAVGDEDQCIYGFRGSRPDCMVDFCSHFEGGKKYFLNRNYRSRSSIIDSAKNLISFNTCRNEKTMRPAREGEGAVTLLRCAGALEQAEKAAEIITSLGCGEEEADTAVLYRTNRECGLITAALFRRGIRFRTVDGAYNLLDQEPCRDMLAYFRLCADPFDRESLIRVINRPNRYIGRTLAERVRNWPVERNVFSLLAEQKGIGLEQAKGILKLERQILRLSRMEPLEAVGFVLGKIGYREHVGRNGPEASALEEFSKLAAGFGSLGELLDYACGCGKEPERAAFQKGGVVLSTIHGSKGLEYRNVIIINCTEGNMPHRNSLGNLEEERRIFYVAVTRAADRLWIISPSSSEGSSSESRFIAELKGEKP
jgi:DNA helicase-2/ATP-dependent DNA helicase PcrA